MSEKKEVASTRLSVYITPTDFSELKREFTSTLFRTFSDFIRYRLRQDPIIKKVRNQSLDELLEILVSIKMDVESIRMGMSFTIEKLRASIPDPNPALDFILAEEIEWKSEVAGIKQALIKLYERWSQQ